MTTTHHSNMRTSNPTCPLGLDSRTAQGLREGSRSEYSLVYDVQFHTFIHICFDIRPASLLISNISEKLKLIAFRKERNSANDGQILAVTRRGRGARGDVASDVTDNRASFKIAFKKRIKKVHSDLFSGFSYKIFPVLRFFILRC
jgi:hypothetical protein